jgi:hypothetical protein
MTCQVRGGGRRPVDLVEAGAVRNPCALDTINQARDLIYVACPG